MASKKRRGRPKGSTKKKSAEASSPQQPQVLPPEKPKTSILGEVKELLNAVFPPSPVTLEVAPQNPETQASPSGHSSPTGSSFDAVVAEGLAEYGSTGEGAAVGPDCGTVSADAADSPDAEPVIPGVTHFVSPEMVRGFFETVTESLAKVHGEHWHMSEAEKMFIVPVNVAMLDEQLPKLFGHLDNPALVAWSVVMVGWIGTKSPDFQKWIMGLFDKLFSMMKRGNAQQ